ncbi:hypothetical protein P7C70_g9396, partial [Phenoliferia sp. Uapishka_3]
MGKKSPPKPPDPPKSDIRTFFKAPSVTPAPRKVLTPQQARSTSTTKKLKPTLTPKAKVDLKGKRKAVVIDLSDSDDEIQIIEVKKPAKVKRVEGAPVKVASSLGGDGDASVRGVKLQLVEEVKMDLDGVKAEEQEEERKTTVGAWAAEGQQEVKPKIDPISATDHMQIDLPTVDLKPSLQPPTPPKEQPVDPPFSASTIDDSSNPATIPSLPSLDEETDYSVMELCGAPMSRRDDNEWAEEEVGELSEGGDEVDWGDDEPRIETEDGFGGEDGEGAW